MKQNLGSSSLASSPGFLKHTELSFSFQNSFIPATYIVRVLLIIYDIHETISNIVSLYLIEIHNNETDILFISESEMLLSLKMLNKM